LAQAGGWGPSAGVGCGFMVSAVPMGGLSLGLLGMDWSYSSPPPVGPSAQVDDDDDVAEMDSHVAAVSALLDEDPAERPSSISPEPALPLAAAASTPLRSDAPEFIPTLEPSPQPPREVAAPLNGPAITSTWIQHDGGDDTYRVCWKVSSTKLLSKDKIVVSPAFGDRTQGLRTFKLLLQPRVKPGLGEEHGALHFGSTRFGSLQLKCVEDSADEGQVHFRLFIGDEPSVALHHDFKSCAVAVHEHLWDLRAGIDAQSRTLNVGVEFSGA